MELIKKYKDFDIPILITKLNNEKEEIQVNKSFIKLLWPKTNRVNYEHLKEFITQHIKQDKVQLDGFFYKVDKVEEGSTNTYFFSQRKSSTHNSFLWLKHDLLNILNPIMGFSDVLMESETIPTDEIELIHKIHDNSRRMYHQIEKLGLLQSINQGYHIIEAEEYRVADFIAELADLLTVNQYIERKSKISIKENAYVSAKISSHDFRNILENQILFFLSYQQVKAVDFSISKNKENVIFRLDFIDCAIPSNYVEEMHLMEKFLNNGEGVEKIQTPGLNYLLLIQLTRMLNGAVSFTSGKQKSKTQLKLSFPITNKVKQKKKSITNNTESEIVNSKVNFLNIEYLPADLYNELSNICRNFDGLIILDEWELLANKIEKTNTNHQNTEVKNIVKIIRDAIKYFDIERLKLLHTNCKLIFQKK